MDKLQLRYYQKEALETLERDLKEKQGNPLIVIPTAGGKSFIIAKFIHNNNNNNNILLLTHRKELIEQNYEELKGIDPSLNIDIYAASLLKKDHKHSIVMASIQSYSRLSISKLKKFDYVLIDEAHLVSADETTQYSTILANLKTLNPNLKVIGFSATPYRLDSGVLTEGESPIFNYISYEVSIMELIEKGYLCSLITKVPFEVDLSNITINAKEYSQKELLEKFNEKELVEKTISDIIVRGKKRKSWLLFAISKTHLEMISQELKKHGITHKTVYSGMTTEQRNTNINLFKKRKIQALINIDILTTGFNSTKIDLIAMLRPTKSTALYVQMVGRGLRTDKDKKDCLILDYAGNIQEHGPIDRIKIINTNSGNYLVKAWDFRRVCKGCKSLMRLEQITCKECGAVNELRERIINHNTTPEQAAILSGNSIWLDVKSIKYIMRRRRSLDITYYHNNADPTTLPLYPLGDSKLKGDKFKDSIEKFEKWFGFMADDDKLLGKIRKESNNDLDYIHTIRKCLLISLLSMKEKKFKEPKSILIIKNAKSFQRTILDYDFDKNHQENLKKINNRDSNSDDLNFLKEEEKILKIIELYNQGYTPKEAIGKITGYTINPHSYSDKAGKLYVKINAIIAGRSNKQYSKYPISDEDWKLKNAEIRFHNSYLIKDGCWIWNKSCDSNGAPRFKIKRSYFNPRNWIFNLANKNKLIKKWRIRNTCKNIKCVNPDHLEIIHKK